MNMMNEARQAQENGGTPSISGMSSAKFITSTPFKGTEAPFQTDLVRDEYKKLCEDHNNLIEFGESSLLNLGLHRSYLLICFHIRPNICTI